MGYGFVIDQSRCIGCHACTVACKQENDVPVGSFRTWVKYVDKGAFPSVRRHFTVLRCNHCDAAPCVEICPVNALHKRPDAIVDLDRDLCIGCRACMQACPYDALYLNEDSGVAEKCHYCAHRTEVGLEPACVNVCPVEAIVSGDVDDPASKIAGLLATQPTSRRRLEKGTRPRLWYIDALPEALVPGSAAEPDRYLWSDRSPGDAPPFVVPGFEPTPDVITTLDAPHPPAWGAHVWLYLVTKNVAAGAALVAPFLGWLGVREGVARDFVPEVVALVFLAITNVLLLHDLGRPSRAWRILLAPNTRSWLVKGSWVLGAFGLVTTAALLARLAHAPVAADALRWLNLPLALLASGYSAWLFRQCIGRDLWMARGLLPRLIARATLLGLALATLLPGRSGWRPAAAGLLVAAIVVAALDARPPRKLTRLGAWAAALARRRELGPAMVLGAGALGFAALFPTQGAQVAAGSLAALLLLVGMTLHERAWIRAGQAVPIS